MLANSATFKGYDYDYLYKLNFYKNTNMNDFYYVLILLL